MTKPPPKLGQKNVPFQSAAGLLGRAGAGGFTPTPAAPKVPTAADLPQDDEKSATQQKPVGGPGSGGKQSTKAHALRPQGRAVSGG